MLPFFIGAYFAYEVVVRVRSAICTSHGIPFNMTRILYPACERQATPV
jgi:hypothetical protein